MVKTQTEDNNRRPNSLNKPIADLGFLSIEVCQGPIPCRGQLEFVTQMLGGSMKLSSTGLAISMTNLIVQNF